MSVFEISTLTILLAQIGAVLLTSGALGRMVRQVGQPLVIAEVMAGIVLGPSVLGRLWPEGMALLFPVSSLPALKALSQLGLVFFMFLIGLDLDPKLLRGRAYAAVAISHSSIILPFALGSLTALALYGSYAPPGVSVLVFVLFFGAAMSVTAFPVLARILAERGLLRSPVGTIALTCAAVDDVSAWCILAIVSAVARAHGMSSALWTCALALAFTLGMLLLVRPVLRRVFARVEGGGALPRSLITLTLLLLMTASGVTEAIGMHALFGAFLFGAILPREQGLPALLKEKLETIAVMVLMPLFFAYSGLRTEMGLVHGVWEWTLTGLLVLCASVGKIGGAAASARLTGLRWREAGAIGVLMNTRGLMELVVLNIGMDLGVISPVVFTMLVVMALVTTAATTPILSWMYPHQQVACSPQLEARESPLPAALSSSG
jgi:Kef-type K+ transport system membrane component KefB